MDFEMSSSCSASALHSLIINKDYESAKALFNEEARWQAAGYATLDEAWADCLAEYSAKKMDLVPATKAKEGDTYLVRIGRVVFVATARRLRDEGLVFYYWETHEWLPTDAADEIVEIRLS